MIEPTKFALFIGVSWALIIAPGPDMFYVITRGMAHGREAGIHKTIMEILELQLRTSTIPHGLIHNSSTLD